jgi:putative transposase
MVAQPGDHPWSSYAGNAALREDRLLMPHPEYAALGVDVASRRRSYQRLVADADESVFLSSMREATDAGYPMIGDRLKAELEKQGARLMRSKPGPRASPAAARNGESGELALTE